MMKKWLKISLIFLFSCVFLVSSYMLLDYFLESKKQADAYDQLADMVASAPKPTQPVQPTEPADPSEPAAPTIPEPLPEYIEVSALTGDMVGWMRIDDTKINYPVMQTPDSPDYYLHTDFYGKYALHGCLYAEEACDIDRPSDNITIYGHHMGDGSMFAGLMKYKNKSYWENHRYIVFDTLTEHHTYEIFAVFTTTATKGKGFSYHHFIDAEDAAEFEEFIQDCRDLSLYDTGIVPVYGDKLITLSTCEYSQKNGRLVVVAARIN